MNDLLGNIAIVICGLVVTMTTPIAKGQIPDDVVRQAIESALRVAEGEMLEQISLNNLLFQRGKFV